MVRRLAFQSIWDVESIAVLDDSTLTITYTKPTDALDDVPYFVLPKHLVKGLDPERFLDWEFWTHPVGNGPYRYVRRIPQTIVELEANPDYYPGGAEDRAGGVQVESILTTLQTWAICANTTR